MSVLGRLFGETEAPTPATPDDPVESSVTYGIYEATLSYRDGSTEMVTYYQHAVGNHGYRFKDEFTTRIMGGVTTTGGTFVPFSTLSRRPEIEHIGTAEVHYITTEPGPLEQDPSATIERVNEEFDA